jgi:hypothetical protein
METDETRASIDDGISQALGLPDLATLRALLGQEPIVCGYPIERETWATEEEVSQLEFELL